MLCCSEDVFLWRWEYRDSPKSHSEAVTDCVRVWVTFLRGGSHDTGMEPLSRLLTGDTPNFLGCLCTVNLYRQRPLLVVTNLTLFLFLHQSHKLLIRMRPKRWPEACCPHTQVQTFLHKYKSLYHGALLSSHLKCKALKGEVKEFLEKLSCKEDNNMRRNASLIIKHMSATDRQRDR